MKSSKKDSTKKETRNFKDTLLEVLKNIGVNLKKFGSFLSRKINQLSKIKIGKFNAAQALLGVLVLIIAIFIVGNMFKSDEVAYPVIYNNSDGDLYLLNERAKNEDKAIKLANGESISNVVYANTTDRYVLFQKKESLYLYDAKEKDETVSLVSDVTGYTFTEDDKYVVALDEEDNLNVYDFKEVHKIDKDVSSIVSIAKDKILYEKESVLYVRSINPKKDDRLKVTEEYDAYVRFSEDGKNVVYLDNEKKLHIFNVKKDKNDKVAENVTTYYCDTKSCEKLFYVQNDDTKSIYYYDGKDSVKVAKDIYSVSAYDVERKMIVFSKLKNGEYSLHFQKVGKDSVKIEDDLQGVRTVKMFEGKDIYYITGENEVKYVRIKGSKVSNVKSIGEDVTGYLFAHKDGYVFVSDVENTQGTLCLVKNGKVKKLDEKVNTSLITIGNEGKNIYYLKDYKTSGDLYVSKGGKGKLIEKDVYNYEYVKNDLIYLIKDYSLSKSKGDLYRYTGKSVKVAENVTRIASSPVYFEVK